MINKNFPCTCGHKYEIHDASRENKYPLAYYSCYSCKSCSEYQPDNLKYLEMKYEESLKNG